MQVGFRPNGDFNDDGRLSATGGDGEPGASAPSPQVRAAFSGPPGLPQPLGGHAPAARRPAQARPASDVEEFATGLLTAALADLRNCSTRAYRLDGTCVATAFEDVVAKLALEDTRHVVIASQFGPRSTHNEVYGLKSMLHDYAPAPVSYVERAIDALAEALPSCGKDFSLVTAQRWADVAPVIETSERKPDLVLVLNESHRSS